jgi:hypothetical protein
MNYLSKPLVQQVRENDIREIPEELYLAVLACRKQLAAGV